MFQERLKMPNALGNWLRRKRITGISKATKRDELSFEMGGWSGVGI